ncbi:hypothetical protein WR25_13971 [Diploscapter pachys]|uniref:Uncharacterized protein n=1 Tax=Diploscapter pachys TaxID=2018661 RepID=A0A2A2M423_9BILA|nr:hypothetical protein WR25_13971 [Diploscapter pachys]
MTARGLWGGLALEDLAHLFGRAGEDDALVGFDERALDDDRIDRHRLEDRCIVGVGQCLGIGFGHSQPLAWGEARGGIEARKLRDGRRVLEIFDDGDVGAGLFEEGEGAARGAAARVVVDGGVHDRRYIAVRRDAGERAGAGGVWSPERQKGGACAMRRPLHRAE